MGEIVIIHRDSETPIRPRRCKVCNGTGKVKVIDNWDVLLGDFYNSKKYKPCKVCGGTGYLG